MDDVQWRVVWRGRFLSSIEELSNWDVMWASWLNPNNPNPHYSYVEYYCCYFDGLLLSKSNGGLDRRVAEGLLTRQEADAVADFHQLFDEYEEPDGDVYDHQAILNDERWRQVVATALISRNRLFQILVDPEERLLLLNAGLSALDASKALGSA